MTITNEAIIEHLIKGQDLDELMISELMERILSGAMPPSQIAASLALLRAKKESPTEIAQAANIVISKALPIVRPSYLYADAVGTGGDGHNTINVSTLASFTAASLGLPMAKHGYLSVSSKCGSADVLNELGVDIHLKSQDARRCLDQYKWCFLFAADYHHYFNSVKNIRQELKIKTIFNIIGPLVNPLAPPIMLVGVYDQRLIRPYAEAIKNLGRRRAMIVHGSGLDEIALHGPTAAALLDDKAIEFFTITPEDLGLSSYGLSDIKGGAPKENAQICLDVLSGKADDAKTSLVAASTGALLWLGEKAKTLSDGTAMSLQAIRAGEPLHTLEHVRGFSHGS